MHLISSQKLVVNFELLVIIYVLFVFSIITVHYIYMYMYIANYQHLTINLKDSIFQMSVYDQALL